MPLLSDSHILQHLLHQLKDPLEVKASANDQVQAYENPYFQSPQQYWSDLALAGGYPSILLLLTVLQKKGLLIDDQEKLIHRYVLAIKKSIEDAAITNLSLFGGLTGVCFAIQQVSLEGNRYARMLQTMNSYLINRVRCEYIEPLQEKVQQRTPISSYLYDVISGISGIGRYFLEDLSQPHFQEISQEIAQVLVDMCDEVSIHGKKVHGWYLSSNDPINWDLKNSSSLGNFNLGLAHGVTGILAFLSSALLRGVHVERQKETIQKIATWIQKKSFYYDSSIQWPDKISWEEEVENKPSEKMRYKNAWCYGTPGISRALFLAGKALEDNELIKFALEAYYSISQGDPSDWLPISPSLCHGVAGLLLITKEMAIESECKDLLPMLKELDTRLISKYSSEFPFGFQDVEFDQSGTPIYLNKIGLLDGSVGILLTLLTINDSDSKWHTPFLIYA